MTQSSCAPAAADKWRTREGSDNRDKCVLNLVPEMDRESYADATGVSSSCRHRIRQHFTAVAALPQAPFHAPTHPSRAAPPEACGAPNQWSGVVRGTKVVGKSHARAMRRCLPAPRRFDLNVPEGGRWGGAGFPRLLLNRRLNPLLGVVLSESSWMKKK